MPTAGKDASSLRLRGVPILIISLSTLVRLITWLQFILRRRRRYVDRICLVRFVSWFEFTVVNIEFVSYESHFIVFVLSRSFHLRVK